MLTACTLSFPTVACPSIPWVPQIPESSTVKCEESPYQTLAPSTCEKQVDVVGFTYEAGSCEVPSPSSPSPLPPLSAYSVTPSLTHSPSFHRLLAPLPHSLPPSLPCSSSMGLTHSPDSEIHIERWSPTPKNPEQTVYFCQFVAARPCKTPCFLPLLIQYTWLGTATPRESVLLICSARFSGCSKCARYLQCSSIFLSANDMFRICRDERGGGGRERERGTERKRVQSPLGRDYAASPTCGGGWSRVPGITPFHAKLASFLLQEMCLVGCTVTPATNAAYCGTWFKLIGVCVA